MMLFFRELKAITLQLNVRDFRRTVQRDRGADESRNERVRGGRKVAVEGAGQGKIRERTFVH